jgi:Zn-dependent protease
MQIIIFEIIILVFSAIIHEYMHGWMANELGDPTAEEAGRLTLNPIPHIDLFGSIILPFLLVLSGTGIVFGWAKPVPFRPDMLRDRKWGAAKVAVAGPLGNIIAAIFFGMILCFVPFGNQVWAAFLSIIVQINLLLAVFNLVPIPPLDGSKVLAAFLPYNAQMTLLKLERYGMFLVIIFITIGFPLLIPVIEFLYKLIVGA